MGDPPPLRVDTPALTWAPAIVTVPPVPVIPAGGDPMSMMISAVMPELAAPLTTDVAATRTREEQFAANLSGARRAYQSTDQAGEQEIRAVADTQLAPVNTAATGSVGGQSGQFLSTSMQTAGQAAQAPAQLMGMAATAPQRIMQGAQGALQHAGQLFGRYDESTGERDDDSRPAQDRGSADDDGAGAGNSAIEPAPVRDDGPGRDGQRDQTDAVDS